MASLGAAATIGLEVVAGVAGTAIRIPVASPPPAGPLADPVGPFADGAAVFPSDTGVAGRGPGTGCFGDAGDGMTRGAFGTVTAVTAGWSPATGCVLVIASGRFGIGCTGVPESTTASGAIRPGVKMSAPSTSKLGAAWSWVGSVTSGFASADALTGSDPVLAGWRSRSENRPSGSVSVGPAFCGAGARARASMGELCMSGYLAKCLGPFGSNSRANW